MVKLLSHFLPISKGILRTLRKPIKHKIYITNLNHDSTGFWLALIVFTVPSPPAVPGVGAFHDPALPHGAKTCATLWTSLDVETPRGPMRSHPRVESVIMVLVVSKNHL
jgi:hypothetical protein